LSRLRQFSADAHQRSSIVEERWMMNESSTYAKSTNDSENCESIRPERLTLVDLDWQQINTIAQTVPGGTKSIQDIYPLTPLQEGFLFHHLLNEKNDIYVIRELFELESGNRVSVFVDVLNKLIARHDILRSSIAWETLPQPVQVVHRQARLPVEEIRLRGDRDAVEQMKDLMNAQGLSIDLRQAPLWRLQVAADAKTNKWYALLHMHHLVCDQKTWNITLEEVALCLQGRDHELPPPVGYRRYVAWALEQVRMRDSESFFRKKLAEVREPTTRFGLPCVHGDESSIQEVHHVLSQDLSQRIRTQAKVLGTTAARLFHAGWALVLAKTSGQDNVVFGTVLLALPREAALPEPMLGPFVNTLPLRLCLGNVTAEELVRQTHTELGELVNHSTAPLALAQRCSGGGRRATLFTSVFNYRYIAGISLSDHNNAWSRATGMRLLATYIRNHYPISIAVDSWGTCFEITARVDRRIDKHRLISHIETAMQFLADSLEHAPHTPALALSILA
jgi:hypothetical protein